MAQQYKKKAWKLNEFVAHAGKVNCLALGHKSGRVIVTGGEDRKVNMWSVGKPNVIMSLSGHNSPVESVRFGGNEESVVAGSLSGALKIWDLEQAKIVRTLTGHNSSIRSLDFYPYGNFVASGSLDTNVKLWDIRRKGCIFTYRGHTDNINSLRFSPDGRWVASAGEDGLLMIWDLTAGKLLHEFKMHNGPVTCVEFHPNEFLLASGSRDRTVKFYDLGTFQLVDSTENDSTPIQSILFHPDGKCLYSAGVDILKVYGWEPAQCHDSIGIAWGSVNDIAMAHNQLIGCSFSQTNLVTHVIDISRLRPLGSSPKCSGTATNRRSFLASDRPPTKSGLMRQGKLPSLDPPSDATNAGQADIYNPVDYQSIFKARSRVNRSPESQPFAAPDDSQLVRNPSTPWKADKDVVQKSPAKAQCQAKVLHAPSDVQPLTPVERPIPEAYEQHQSPVLSPADPIPKKGSSDISMDDFMPNVRGNSQSQQSEMEVLTSVNQEHMSMMAILSNRSKNLQIVRALWTGGNVRTAVESAINIDDQAVTVDLFSILNQKQSLWSLDLCETLLPQIQRLLASKYDTYVQVGSTSLRHILKNFGTLIKSNVNLVRAVGVDITREERAAKCRACYKFLNEIRTLISGKSFQQGKMGPKFKELLLLMNQLD